MEELGEFMILYMHTFSMEKHIIYRGYITMVTVTIVSGDISVISFIKYLINGSEKVYPGLQFSLRVVSLGFCQNKRYIFPLWGHMVSVRAAEKIPMASNT